MIKRTLIALFIVLFLPAVSLSAPVGKVYLIKGRCDIKAGNNFHPAKINQLVSDTDIINVEQGQLIIRLKNGKMIAVNEGLHTLSNLLNNKEDAKSKLSLLKNKLMRGKTYNQSAPTAVAGVRGDDVSSLRRSPINPSDLIWEE